MRKFISKKSILIVTLALLLTVAVGSTLAYIFMHTKPVNNTFTPAQVSCAVVENGGRLVTNAIVNTGSKKTNVQIKNTGDTDAYIRVAIVITWKSADATKVWAQKPVEGIDYTITMPSNTGWISASDGYYYYSNAVSSNAFTGFLIEKVTLKDGSQPPVGPDGTKYYLSVEIVASAIQADGMGVTSAQDAWAKAKSQGSN